MNDATVAFSTSSLPQAPPNSIGQTLVEAVRHLGPAELVAELDRQVAAEEAKLAVTKLVPRSPPVADDKTCALSGVRWALDRHQELLRIARASALRSCVDRLLQHLLNEATAGRLTVSYLPSDPAAPRVFLAAERSHYLTTPSIGVLFDGWLADALRGFNALSGMLKRPPVGADVLCLDGQELRHVWITPSTAVAAASGGIGTPAGAGRAASPARPTDAEVRRNELDVFRWGTKWTRLRQRLATPPRSSYNATASG